MSRRNDYAEAMAVLTLAVSGDTSAALARLEGLGIHPGTALNVVAVILAVAMGGLESDARAQGWTPLEMVQRLAIMGQTR